MLRVSSINAHNVKRVQARLGRVGDTYWIALFSPDGGPDFTFFFEAADHSYFERLVAAINAAGVVDA